MKEFEVYENNGGGLILVVYNDQLKVEYIHSGYEFSPGQLLKDIENIKAGDDPATQWEGNELEEFDKNTIKAIEAFESQEWGTLIANKFGPYPFLMGAAGKKEFGI